MRDAESVFQVGTWWLMALTWPGYITLAVFAPFLLRVYGHGFVAGQVALAILCAAQLFNLGTGNVTIVLLMAGKSSWNLINSAAALAANIVINILLIPRLGITGAAIAWAASIIINNLAAVLEVNYLMRIRPFGTGYWLVAISSTICFGMTGLIIRQIVGANATGFLLFVVVSTLPYAAVLWRARVTLRFSAFRGAISRRRLAQAGR
jgi:O-antigen/teichoic acid export membrane protein